MVFPNNYVTKIPPERQSKHGLPMWAPDYLPLQGQILLLKNQHLKPWHKCVHCKQPTKYCCAGCAMVKFRDKQRYCSLACMKADWKTHGSHCPEFVAVDKMLESGRTPEQTKFIRKQLRQASRWTRVIKESRMVDWVVKQAFRATSHSNPENICLDIQLETIEEHPLSPIVPKSFQWKPFVPREGDTLKPSEDSKLYTHYNIVMNGVRTNHDSVDLKIGDFDDALAGWPYIFAHCVLMADINPTICKIRLQSLSVTLQAFPHIAARLPHFERFETMPEEEISPTYEDGSERAEGWHSRKLIIEQEAIDRWMEYMYPVTCKLGSRFHIPCDYARRRYGHIS